MAALPVNNTGRVWMDYTANSNEHSMQFRYGGAGLPPPVFLSGLSDVLQAWDTFTPTDFQVNGWRYSVEGSTVSLPFNPGIVLTPGLWTPTPGFAPSYMTAVGRTNNGRRVRISLLGAGISAVGIDVDFGDYRITTAEDAGVLALYQQLISASIVGIDGAATNWYPYVNLGFNAYWQRESRP